MKEKIRFIYKITNLVNNKVYIGQHYGYVDDSYMGSGVLIIKAIKKYGKENFKKEIVEVCNTIEEINLKENYYIKYYKSYAPTGYNIATGGEGGDTFSHNPNIEQIRKKIKNNHADFSGKNHPSYGLKRSEYTKKLIGEKSKLKKGFIWVYNPETNQEKCVMKGQTIPDGFIHGRKPSPLKGIPLSESTKIKLSLSKKGRKQSLKQRQKQSERQMGTRWWHNGIISKFCKENPGPEWKPGRIIHKIKKLV